MIDIKVDYPMVKHIVINGETYELFKEIMLMNCVIAEHIKLKEKGGKVYSTAEKIMKIAEDLANIALEMDKADKGCERNECT